MPKSCNGRSVVYGDISESPGGVVETELPIEDAKSEFPPDDFYGFVKIPRVVLVRYDISPYLNGKKALNPKFKPKDDSIHKERLSQRCVVRVARENLEWLKASLRRYRTRIEPLKCGSDSEDSNCPDMPFKCKICDKSYNSEKKLSTHQRTKHIIYTNSKPMKHVSFSDHVVIHEVEEYHKCRKCPKIFENYRALKAHTKLEHKKRKCYICNYCKINFVDRMFFKVHIKLHCDVCTELFPTRSKWLEHRRDVCRVVKLHKCKTCSESFYNIMDLKDHSYDHSSACYVCDVCKDHFESKCSIAHHISFLHSLRHPESLYTMLKVGNERLYLCNFCDMSSVDRDILENHLQNLPDLNNRAMTDYKNLYFCDHCKEKFPLEQDLLQHKWTHFLKSNDNSQMILTKRKTIRMTYNVNEELPSYLKPKLVLEKLNLEEGSSHPLEFIDLFDIKSENGVDPQTLKKAIVDPKSKKTIISKYHCEICGKYYSTNYCLNRHIATQHGEFENLRCGVCEETFVWPSLLKSHKCIRLNHPEMPFDDARPEIHFDNIQYRGYNDLNNRFNDLDGRLDDLTIDDDYIHPVDFDIPAPIVELTEYDAFLSPNTDQPMGRVIQEKDCQLQSLGYKLVMQEVPIEF